MRTIQRFLLASFVTSYALVSARTNQSSFGSIQVKDFQLNSKAGRDLLASATVYNDGKIETPRHLEDGFSDFVGDYAIKFLNCHSVTQWNGSLNSQANEGDGDDDGNADGDVKIIHERLIRFRLCPVSSCLDNAETGCSTKFGDYLVDAGTFIYYYFSAQAEANQDIVDKCEEDCGDDDSNCQGCFSSYGGVTFEEAVSGGDDDGAVSLDPTDYATCTAFDSYYLGPYCSSDGLSIFLGIFSDSSCSTFSSCGESCFSSKYNVQLPYSSSSSSSMVSKNCLSCADGTFHDGYDNADPKDECKSLYQSSGKCESKLYIDYPNESGCSYIEGLRYLDGDGVINSGLRRKSKMAGVMIGLMLFASSLLSVYVYFLFKKLQRAKFHLEADDDLPNLG